ncbi:amino acid permease [Maribellus sp. CM-23]|uniref:APC family permease n=1 Tax=Maribellus sp. CM-23 TaxID=2781026 RepID=UPI001F2CCDEA|nr:amino acid permease [Maribellus sp. CM-23]MCE4563262.1 amino acid permease [Maribellus sp. CM-23]
MSDSNQQLERKLGLFPVTNIVVANIIGAGIFTTTGYIMDFLGNPWMMIILWCVGGVISFCGALAFGELGAAYPEAGGEYVFISKLFSPLLGFLSGWLSLLVAFSAPIAASAIGFSKYLTWAFPGFQNELMLNGVITPETFSSVLAILLILGFSLIHSLGVVFGARIQNVLTVFKVLLLIGLIVAGFAFGEGSFTHFRSSSLMRFDFANWKEIGLALVFVMFAYSGWNSATYIGSEIRNPRKVILRSLLISTLIVTVLYVLLNLFFVYAIPPGQMVGETEIGGLAAGNAFGPVAEKIISLLIAFALFSSLSAFIILGPRVYFQMARDGYFFKSIAVIHPKRKVPVNALYLQAVIAIVLVLSGTFEQILVYMGFALGIFPVLAVAGVFVLRKREKSVLPLWGYPWVHLIFIITGIAMLVLAYCQRPVESSVAILTVLSGIPVFYWFNARKKKLKN